MTLSDKMRNAVKNARSAYQREWRKKNPTKTKEYNNRYWERRVMREQMQEKEKGENGNSETIYDN